MLRKEILRKELDRHKQLFNFRRQDWDITRSRSGYIVWVVFMFMPSHHVLSWVAEWGIGTVAGIAGYFWLVTATMVFGGRPTAA